MTNVGSTYCGVCWDFYNRIIAKHYGKLANGALRLFIREREEGGGADNKPRLHTQAKRNQAKQSG